MENKQIIIKESERQFSVEYWRERFTVLSDQMPNGVNRIDLVGYDGYFLTAVGKSAFSNVKRGAGGLEPTMRAVKALEGLIKSRADKARKANNLAKRQKLVIPG